jgi:hypothetical protein
VILQITVFNPKTNFFGNASHPHSRARPAPARMNVMNFPLKNLLSVRTGFPLEVLAPALKPFLVSAFRVYRYCAPGESLFL